MVHAGRVLGKVSTAGSAGWRVLPVATYPAVRSGRLVVRVLTTGKPVHIDGVVAPQQFQSR